MPSFASTMKRTRSASSMATSAWRRTASSRPAMPPTASLARGPGTSSSPPVSTSENSRPRHSTVPYSRSRVVPGRSSTIASRSPTSRLKRVDLPTLGRPTTATTARGTLGGERFRALLHFDERLHRRRAPADEADALLACEPRRLELGGVLDVMRVASLHAGKVHELAGVRGVFAPDHDDHVRLARKLGGRVLPLDRHRADGVEDLRLLRDLRDVRDELLERPWRLRRLRDDTRLLHLRQALPLLLRLDDDVVRSEERRVGKECRSRWSRYH